MLGIRTVASAARRAVGAPVRRAIRRVAADLRADPVLGYILLLALLLAGFGIWHRLPNFATRDERWRVADPMEVVGFVVDDPTLGSLREGVLYWRSYGATLYLYGLAILPVVAFAFVTGRLDVFVDAAHHRPRAYWGYWNRVPSWVWTASVLLARLANVSLAVGCVYVTYRIGTTLRDRATGRLSALLLSLTWGFLVLAHEAGEDVPSLFFLLLTLYFAIRYLETGDVRSFYWGCACGGLAVGFKLTAGVGALLLGGAFLLRSRRADRPWRVAVRRPRLLAGGAAVGVGAVALGYPALLAGAPGELGARVVAGLAEKGRPHGWIVAPSWWWLLRGYLHGLGLPLFIGAIGGLAAIVRRPRRGSLADDGLLLALAGAAAYLTVFASWAYVRTHHLLPTFPLLILALSVALGRLTDRNPGAGRVATLALVLGSAAYAGAGDLGYASQPRDRAAAWLASHAPADATVETYVYDPQDAAVPHGTDVSQPADRSAEGRSGDRSIHAWTRALPSRCPAFVQLNYQRSLLALAPADHSARARTLSIRPLAPFYRELLSGDAYPYRIAAEFGPAPRYRSGRDPLPPAVELLRVGVVPRTVQYGDPQDFGVQQYTVILARTGPCDRRSRGTPSGG